MKLLTATLDGKHIGYSSETEFLVQVSRGRGSYRTVARFAGNLAGAVIHYNGVNTYYGYNKRLYAPSFGKPVLARQKS